MADADANAVAEQTAKLQLDEETGEMVGTLFAVCITLQYIYTCELFPTVVTDV